MSVAGPNAVCQYFSTRNLSVWGLSFQYRRSMTAVSPNPLHGSGIGNVDDAVLRWCCVDATSPSPRGGRRCRLQSSGLGYEACLNVSLKTEPVPSVWSFPLLMSKSPPFNALNSVGLSKPR